MLRPRVLAPATTRCCARAHRPSGLSGDDDRSHSSQLPRPCFLPPPPYCIALLRTVHVYHYTPSPAHYIPPFLRFRLRLCILHSAVAFPGFGVSLARSLCMVPSRHCVSASVRPPLSAFLSSSSLLSFSLSQSSIFFYSRCSNKTLASLSSPLSILSILSCTHARTHTDIQLSACPPVRSSVRPVTLIAPPTLLRTTCPCPAPSRHTHVRHPAITHHTTIHHANTVPARTPHTAQCSFSFSLLVVPSPGIHACCTFTTNTHTHTLAYAHIHRIHIHNQSNARTKLYAPSPLIH
ncbi:hypothetical protein C8Q77DRAFT_1144006 [Trametes polyzona]|nr:hypothetical protein C8Q77DRAFT_1144006 [Trametes polyzona]